MASGSSLNNVVNSLVRASMGASVSPTVTDADLDRHVAELILKEAKTKAEKYAKEGIRAYLPQTGSADSNAPRTNKRFLSSLVKNVSDHNKVIIQAQAEAAEQVKEAKRQEEMKDRRRRAEEAAADNRMRVQRLFSQGLRNSGDSWKDRDRRKDEGRSERRSRSPRRRERDSRRSRSPRRRSPSPSRKHKSSRNERKSEHKHRKRDRSQSQEDDRSSKRRSDRKRDSEPPKHDSDTRSRKEKGKDRAENGDRQEGSSLTPEPIHIPASSSRRSTRSPSPTLFGPPYSTYSSKMDKYFCPSYDPRLDIEQPSVNKTGPLQGAQWEGWEGMLELMRLRAQDKEEKKRREREDRDKDKFDRKRAKQKGVSGLGSSTIPDSTEEAGLMDMKYKKRGAVKEWDLAKETPT